MAEVPVKLPGSISMDTAYDGMSKRRPRRALKPLERDILVRLIDDVLYELHNHHDLEHLVFRCGGSSIRMETFEVGILHNIREAINPRSE